MLTAVGVLKCSDNFFNMDMDFPDDNSPIQSMDKKRRLSILKRPKQDVEVDLPEETDTRNQRKVRFSSNYVKPFTTENDVTIWDNTYEEVIGKIEDSGNSTEHNKTDHVESGMDMTKLIRNNTETLLDMELTEILPEKLEDVDQCDLSVTAGVPNNFIMETLAPKTSIFDEIKKKITNSCPAKDKENLYCDFTKSRKSVDMELSRCTLKRSVLEEMEITMGPENCEDSAAMEFTQLVKRRNWNRESSMNKESFHCNDDNHSVAMEFTRLEKTAYLETGKTILNDDEMNEIRIESNALINNYSAAMEFTRLEKTECLPTNIENINSNDEIYKDNVQCNAVTRDYSAAMEFTLLERTECFGTKAGLNEMNNANENKEENTDHSAAMELTQLRSFRILEDIVIESGKTKEPVINDQLVVTDISTSSEMHSRMDEIRGHDQDKTIDLIASIEDNEPLEKDVTGVLLEDQSMDTQHLIMCDSTGKKQSCSDYSKILAGDYKEVAEPNINFKSFGSSFALSIDEANWDDEVDESKQAATPDEQANLSNDSMDAIIQMSRLNGLEVSPEESAGASVLIDQSMSPERVDFQSFSLQELLRMKGKNLNYEPIKPSRDGFKERADQIFELMDRLVKAVDTRFMELESTMEQISFQASNDEVSGDVHEDIEMIFPQTLEDTLLDLVNKCENAYTLTHPETDVYEIKTLYGAITLRAQLEPHGPMVNTVKINSNLAEDCEPIAVYIRNLFMEKLSAEHIKASVGGTYSIFTLLDYVQLNFVTFEQMLDDYYDLQCNYYFCMDSPQSCALRIIEPELVVSLIIRVQIEDVFKTNPTCIEVECKVGHVPESEIKKLSKDCPLGFKFFRCFIEKVNTYIEDKKKVRLVQQ